MAYWDCPKCAAENPLEATACQRCGYQYFPGFQGADTSREATRQLRDSLRKQSRGVLDEIRRGLAGSLDESAASLDQLTADLSRAAGIDMGAPVGADRQGTAPPPQQAPSLQKPGASGQPARPSAFERVTTRDLRVEAQALPRLNYALVHCGFPLIKELQVSNSSGEAANDILLKAWVATDYGEPWQKSVAAIPAGQSLVEKDIIVPLRKSRLQEVREAERANLRLDVFSEGDLQVSRTWPLEVLAYNEWYYHPQIAEATACFIQPNSEAIETIISMVRDRLRKEFRETDLSGYQTGSREKVAEMLEALYRTLQQDLKITYINPPPSFEQPEQLADGKFSISQKVFFPEQILEHRRGTCLDLALMCAACVERMGLNPICFLIRGHAFLGAWLEEKALREPVLRDNATVQNLLAEGLWLPLNSTTFTSAPQRPFSTCVEEGRYCLSSAESFWCAIDVRSARMSGIKPIPPLSPAR